MNTHSRWFAAVSVLGVLAGCGADADTAGRSGAASSMNDIDFSGPRVAAGAYVRRVLDRAGHAGYFSDCGDPSDGLMHCMHLVPSDATGKATVSTTPTGLAPSDIQSAYDIPPGGAGQTVAVVDSFDNPNVESDLQVYRTYYGLPACTTANGCFKKVNQTGQTGPLPSQASSAELTEISLDVEMVSAACPKCKILLVETTSSNLSDMGPAQATAAAGAAFVSDSWGGGEAPSDTSAEAYFNHPGASFYAAAGDSGFGVAYPSTSANVTSVGGTALFPDSGLAGRKWDEQVWSGTGSGCSAYISRPAWQTLGVTDCFGRSVNDVSAVAVNVATYDSLGVGGWIAGGGTSYSAPIVASIYAASVGRGNAKPALSYVVPVAAFNDVSVGSNGTSCPWLPQCNGEVGYDGPTGNGSPNGALLATANMYTPRVRGNFNGDAYDDFIEVDATGSHEMLGNADGSFTTAWTRTNLTLGSVAYTVGDFTGDGLSDLIITDANGSFEYAGLAGTAGFAATSWQRSDLSLGNVSYTVGNFNDDKPADLIVTTKNGSFEYTGVMGGGFTSPWSNTSLTLGNVNFFAGNFNGDTQADLIVVTASGSSEYAGLPAGGFTPDVWTRSDLTLSNVQYVVGDFNCDHKSDLIIVDGNGSFEYTGLAPSGFTPNVWQRANLTLGTVGYTVGDFNQDSCSDLLIADANGGFEYTGRSAGGFSSPWSLSGGTLHGVTYFAGDFNGDGKSDLLYTAGNGTYELNGVGGTGGFTTNAWVGSALEGSSNFF
jgi:hypothetical protein